MALPGPFRLLPGRVYTVGRVEGAADVLIALPTVSGTHAQIDAARGEEGHALLTITDLQSTNGTFVSP